MIKTPIQSLIGTFHRFFPAYERKGPEIPDGLAWIAHALGSQLSDADPKMMHLGRQFQQIYSETGDLTRMVEHTMEIVGVSGDNNTLSGVGDFASSSVNRLAAFRNRISDSLKTFESGMSYLGTLSEMCSNTDKIALLLNVIALNIGIESNRSDKSSEMFTVFVDEVKELSDNIGGVSKTLYDDARSALGRYETSVKEINTHLTRLTGLVRSSKEALDKSGQTIERLMNRSLSSLEVVSQCSKSISQQVGEIVVNMQFHDIIRQKTEHIIHALTDAETRYGREKHDKKNDSAWLLPVLKLQSAQMQSIITEIDDARGNILNAFKGIEQHVSELFSCIAGTFITGEEACDDGNPFTMVINTLETVDSLTSEAFSLASMVNDTISDSMKSSSDLLKHVDTVQHISLDLHRKALNAIIKAAHLGDMGRAIEVFAQEVTTTSNESNRFADTITRLINAIAETAASLDQKALMEHTESGTSLSKGIENIRGAFRAYTDSTGRVSERSRKVEQSIAHAKEGLLFLETFSAAMTILVEKTEMMISGIGDSDPGGIESVLANSSDRYTMESERLVHSQVFGELRENSTFGECRAEELSGPDDMEGAIDNTTSKEAGETAPSEKEEPAGPEDTKKTKSEKDELGDNIELF